MEITLFPLGSLMATAAALGALVDAGQIAETFLARHSTGDWGDLCEEDKRENDFSITSGFRVLSSYQLRNGQKIWVITEADRSTTTILLPDEY